jgi:formate dehydrogenase major subunit
MTIGRRDWMKGVAAGGAAAAAGGAAATGDLFVTEPSRAAALKLAGAKEFTTICNFCSCGCGMVGHVLDGKLVNLEGDPDHVVNEGALCVKGSAMLATHQSPQRLRTPRYRAPGSDRWVDLSWDEALAKLAAKLKATRDATWVATEKDGDREFQVNRSDAFALLGGAQSTNEECYLWTKLGRLLGTNYVEHQARL